MGISQVSVYSFNIGTSGASIVVIYIIPSSIFSNWNSIRKCIFFPLNWFIQLYQCGLINVRSFFEVYTLRWLKIQRHLRVHCLKVFWSHNSSTNHSVRMEWMRSLSKVYARTFFVVTIKTVNIMHNTCYSMASLSWAQTWFLPFSCFHFSNYCFLR